ncbi:MAG: enoyl-CoA hydratase/isomerase family protein [Desulfobacterales bacterium]|jgi:enoyl-CoA hydratase/carnithine racemase|nr:enoyl-CoA hydratase/isomerase family protein [Desulfobacterales bacterium]MDH3827958.1 enoyl-CoA hydratase/isomerase family protein [Desulfobacterales bacterium]
MSAFETLIYEKEGTLALVTLNRPRVLNAFNIQMRDDLFEVLTAIRDDDEVRVALLKGAGEKAFCVGADLSEFLTAPSPVAARQIRFDRDVWGLLLNIPQPLIAVLHGYVLGSGIEMALCCDLRIASDDAQFGLPEVELGIIPAAGGTQTLPRAVGRACALEMLLTGRRINAQEALQRKLVNRVVPADRLLETARGMAEKIAARDPDIIKGIKKAVMDGMDLPLAQGLDLEKMLATRGARALFQK